MISLALMEGVSVKTKTYVTFWLVILALFEFVTAMHVFGRKGKKAHPQLMLTLHRCGGYAFLLFWLWPVIVGADLLTRLSRYQDGWQFDGPRFYHAFLGVTVLVLLVMKILFVRVYTQYRQSARILGIVITALAVITWLIAGWFWLCMMGGARVG
jgi:hypothetical protein